MSADSTGDQYARIARALRNESGVAATLMQATTTALSLIEGCDHAGVSLVLKGKGRRIETVAPTDEIAVQAARLQYELGEGPCLQSIDGEESVYAPDLRAEGRWPQWARAVSEELGIRSILSLQLFVGPAALGSLNLYSDRAHAYDADDHVAALALAAHVAVAMSAAQDRENFDSAIAHRTVIGQAEGMLIQALKLSPDEAFAALVRVSQHQNRKLHLIAADLVHGGFRPELFD
jgi:hypothetical protein